MQYWKYWLEILIERCNYDNKVLSVLFYRDETYFVLRKLLCAPILAMYSSIVTPIFTRVLTNSQFVFGVVHADPSFNFFFACFTIQLLTSAMALMFVLLLDCTRSSFILLLTSTRASISFISC